MCFYRYEPANEESNFKQVGHLKVTFVDEPNNNSEAIIICCNSKLVSGHETLEHNLDAESAKANYLKEKSVLKAGHVARIAVEAHATVRVILYVVLPESNTSLKDFFLHKGLVRALEMALRDEKCVRVNMIAPKFNLLGLSEEEYVQKLTSSLKIIGLKTIPGVISVQLKSKFRK
jgi:hypothetical protein